MAHTSKIADLVEAEIVELSGSQKAFVADVEPSSHRYIS